jgi:hypothetical protein
MICPMATGIGIGHFKHAAANRGHLGAVIGTDDRRHDVAAENRFLFRRGGFLILNL